MKASVPFLFPCGKECRSGRMSAPFCPVSPELPLNAATPQPSLRGPTFSVLPEKVGKKRRWMRIRLYRGATEEPRRRTLRPTHENLSAKLHYSAACAGTTLPSGVVSTQEDGKTPCCGDNNASTVSPTVQCRILRSIVNLCRGRCGHRPLQGAVQHHNCPSIPEMSRTEIIAVCP